MAEVFCILSTGRTILHGSEAAVPSTESTRATFGTYLFSFPDGTDWILLGSGSIHQNINPRDLQGNHKDRRIVSEGCKGVTVVLLVADSSLFSLLREYKPKNVWIGHLGSENQHSFSSLKEYPGCSLVSVTSL